jgi:hypothetical protein
VRSKRVETEREGALREELRKEFSDRGLLGSGRGSQGIVLNKL